MLTTCVLMKVWGDDSRSGFAAVIDIRTHKNCIFYTSKHFCSFFRSSDTALLHTLLLPVHDVFAPYPLPLPVLYGRGIVSLSFSYTVNLLHLLCAAIARHVIKFRFRTLTIAHPQWVHNHNHNSFWALPLFLLVLNSTFYLPKKT